MWYRSGGEVSTVPFAKWKAVKTGGARLRTSAVHTPAFAVTPAADRHLLVRIQLREDVIFLVLHNKKYHTGQIFRLYVRYDVRPEI